jgi:hypothetical protein
MPGLGGPFDSAADFFKAFAKYATFPTSEETIRKYTPPELVEEVLKSINDFPSKLENFAQHYRFQEGPFPIFHNDLYKSNVLVDSEYNVQAVIDWDGAIVVPWEAVEFIDELTLLPPAMMASYYKEEDLDRQNAAECRKYVEVVKKTEKARQFDGKLSTVLGDQKIQSLAQGIWLHQKAGKIGFYSSILELFELEE